ncbi:MAG: glutamine--fructose-6-phosphate transaminase (isomerizing) [Oscillospiraceae bacterium]|nr:glutamine--fructose-6-phosphate transaminase (isomerizing) [Oscillospiraceae bacterium]
MCGIIGYTGHRQACNILLDGLQRLEYRGYDSAGVLVEDGGTFTTVKKSGKLDNLRAALKDREIIGTCGIGHTRWATHGGPTDENAHPHGTAKVMLVHNGIIENYLDLKAFLTDKGYTFTSQTDTEIAACIVDYCYHGDPVKAMRDALAMLRGAYAFAVVFADHPGKIYATRKDGPLLIAPGEGENFLTSDLSGVVEHTNRFFTLEEGEIAVLASEDVTVLAPDGSVVEKVVETANWNMEQAQKNGFEDFMLKEIHEQPEALIRTIRPRVKDGMPCFDSDKLDDSFFKSFSDMWIVGCGTAMHAGLVGRILFERLARIPTKVEIASEFRYSDPILSPNSLVVIISQSGETADSLAALRLAKAKGCKTLAIVNVIGSSISREADYVLYTYAGPEISVCSTKAYTVQIALLYLLSFKLALENGKIDSDKCRSLTASLLDSANEIASVVEMQDIFCRYAENLRDVEHLFFLGRGLDYALACEGSLKLKEISYIHCEAYAAGELKHGTISLITDGVPVVALATQEDILEKTLSNIKEVKARGASVFLIAAENKAVSDDIADNLITLNDTSDLFMTFPAVTALQLIAYYTAKKRGCDIDKPRNLAKSVTVE